VSSPRTAAPNAPCPFSCQRILDDFGQHRLRAAVKPTARVSRSPGSGQGRHSRCALGRDMSQEVTLATVPLMGPPFSRGRARTPSLRRAQCVWPARPPLEGCPQPEKKRLLIDRERMRGQVADRDARQTSGRESAQIVGAPSGGVASTCCITSALIQTGHTWNRPVRDPLCAVRAKDCGDAAWLPRPARRDTRRSLERWTGAVDWPRHARRDVQPRHRHAPADRRYRRNSCTDRSPVQV